MTVMHSLHIMDHGIVIYQRGIRLYVFLWAVMVIRLMLVMILLIFFGIIILMLLLPNGQ